MMGFQINPHALRPTTNNESCNQSVTFNIIQIKPQTKHENLIMGIDLKSVPDNQNGFQIKKGTPESVN
jgi:hypothetical protein